MKRTKLTLFGAVLTAVALLGLFASTGCQNAIQSLLARDQLNKGVNAFKNANYPQAVEHFEKAVRMDPNLINARLYLATAYMSQFVPGAESEENKRNAGLAERGFRDVLERDPNNALAIESLGSLMFNQKKFEEAKQWYMKVIELNKEKKEAYYNVAVIDWTNAWQRSTEVRVKTGMRTEEPGPIKDRKAREELKEKNEPVIKEGMDMLQRALAIDPNYDDAMGYLSLLYRQQADIADSTEESKKLTAQAEEWIQKYLNVKKKRTEGALTQPKTG